MPPRLSPRLCAQGLAGPPRCVRWCVAPQVLQTLGELNPRSWGTSWTLQHCLWGQLAIRQKLRRLPGSSRRLCVLSAARGTALTLALLLPLPSGCLESCWPCSPAGPSPCPPCLQPTAALQGSLTPPWPCRHHRVQGSCPRQSPHVSGLRTRAPRLQPRACEMGSAVGTLWETGLPEPTPPSLLSGEHNAPACSPPHSNPPAPSSS